MDGCQVCNIPPGKGRYTTLHRTEPGMYMYTVLLLAATPTQRDSAEEKMIQTFFFSISPQQCLFGCFSCQLV